VKIVIQPYTREWEPAVAAFNDRLAPQRMPVYFQFPQRSAPDWLPPREDRRIRQEYYLAIEEEKTVRGGYILKTQDFWVDGIVETIGNLQLPLSEGIVDPRYNFVGVQLVSDALRRQPALYSLGMGGLENPYPRLLRGLRWSMYLVPFFFRVVRPARFLRGLTSLRTSATRKFGLDLLALTGAGWLGIKLLQGLAARRNRRPSVCDVEPQLGFGDWADEVWEVFRGHYTLVAIRDRSALETLYNGNVFPGLIVLRMTRNRKNIGWAAVLDTAMTGHRQFGNLRVGSIVDGFSAPDDAPAVIRSATLFLEQRKVDLIVSNQTHRAWVEGLRAAGFWKGPSNFALAFSRALAAKIPSCERRWGEFHFNRGDGDGPINL
jgi:hypothetical protein